MRKFSQLSIPSKIVIVATALFFLTAIVGVIGFAMKNVHLTAVAFVCGTLMWPVLILGGIILKGEEEYRRSKELD